MTARLGNCAGSNTGVVSGAAVCIGMSLAMTEAMLILATLAQRYRLELTPGQSVELQHMVTLRPRGGLSMALHPRA